MSRITIFNTALEDDDVGLIELLEQTENNEELAADVQNDAVDAVGDTQRAALEEYNDLVSTMRVVYGLRKAFEELENKAEVTPEDVVSFQTQASELFENEDMDVPKPITALESYSDPKVAMESISSTMSKAFSFMNSKFVSYFGKLGSTITYLLRWVTTSQADLTRLAASMPSSGKVTIKVPVNNCLRYGKPNKVVKDEKEYLKKLEEASDLLETYLTNFGEFVNKDLFNSIKVLFSPMTGYSDWYRTNANTYYNMLERTAKNASLKKTTGDYGEKSAVSETMLGLFNINLGIPDVSKEDFRTATIGELRSHVSNMHIGVRRQYVSDAAVADEKYVEFTVDKAYVNKLVSVLTNMIGSYKKFGGFVNRLTTATSVSNILNIPLNIVGTAVFYALFANYRLYLKMTSELTFETGTAFNLAVAHTNKAKNIIKQAIKAK